MLMQKAPKKTKMHAYTRFLPRRTRQLSSLRKSSDMSSTREAKIKSPDEIAFMQPTTSRPTSESGLYKVWVARPIACPMGVLETGQFTKNICWEKMKRNLRAAISKGHDPRLKLVLPPRQRGDSRAQCQTLECFCLHSLGDGGHLNAT